MQALSIATVRNNRIVCASPLAQSETWRQRFGGTFNLFSTFLTSSVLYGGTSVTAEQPNEFASCQAVMLWLQLMFGFIFPTIYLLKLSPPVVVAGANESRIDRKVIEMLTAFCMPSERLLVTTKLKQHAASLEGKMGARTILLWHVLVRFGCLCMNLLTVSIFFFVKGVSKPSTYVYMPADCHLVGVYRCVWSLRVSFLGLRYCFCFFGLRKLYFSLLQSVLIRERVVHDLNVCFLPPFLPYFFTDTLHFSCCILNESHLG